jgi:hypothetical protein
MKITTIQSDGNGIIWKVLARKRFDFMRYPLNDPSRKAQAKRVTNDAVVIVFVVSQCVQITCSSHDFLQEQEVYLAITTDILTSFLDPILFHQTESSPTLSEDWSHNNQTGDGKTAYFNSLISLAESSALL